MPKFIKLTRDNGEIVYLNADYIFRVIPDSRYNKYNTVVSYCYGTSFDTYYVKETVDIILNQIEGKAYVK